MKKVVLGIGIFLLIASLGISQEEPLELILEPEKETYRLGDEINVHVVLKNTSQKEITVCDIWLPSMQIKFTATRNGAWVEPFDIEYELKDIRKEDFVRLEPGGNISKIFDVSRCVPIEEPGTYNIKVSYKNWWDWYDDSSGGEMKKVPVDAWKGTLESDAVSIEVVK